MKIAGAWKETNKFTLFEGDCASLIDSLPENSVRLAISSPPYCIGKVYEDETKASDFVANHESILPAICQRIQSGGSLCWQVGYHIDNGVSTPLDFVVYEILKRKCPEMILRNRIIWTFGHGLHSSDRFSGRHETILWFTKGDDYVFNLDEVRIPQKYPGKLHYKGEKKGKPSGNPLGKNPSDVWDIPNVKANHVEKTDHPCQFPIALAQRLILALSKRDELVLDPYLGSGTTGAACALLGRRFVGAELKEKYLKIAKNRIKDALEGKLLFRPEDRPVYQPLPNTPLTTVPEQWRKPHEGIPVPAAKAG